MAPQLVRPIRIRFPPAHQLPPRAPGAQGRNPLLPAAGGGTGGACGVHRGPEGDEGGGQHCGFPGGETREEWEKKEELL